MRTTVAVLSTTAAWALLCFGCTKSGGGATPPSTPETVAVRIVGFNDFHGALLPPKADGPGGVAYLAGHLTRMRAESPNTVVVAAGDLIGASPLVSSLLHDEPSIEALNAAGLDFASVGNHEFDEGRDELLRMQGGGCHPEMECTDPPFAGASFQYLAANVRTESGETLFPAYGIRDFGAVRVAVIGMTLEDTPSVTRPTGVTGLSFADEADTVNALIPELRDQGVETVVVVVHEGGEQSGSEDACDDLHGPIGDIAERLDDAVDVLVTGHTHQAYVCELHGKLVTSAGSSGRLLTQIDLRIDAKSGDVVSAVADNVVVTADVEPDPEVARIVAAAEERARPLTEREVATVPQAYRRRANEAGESELGKLVADAQRAAGKAHGSQVAFMNPGGIRTDLPQGVVTYADVFAVHPFGNRLVTLTLTGAQLHELLEAQWAGEGHGTTILAVSKGSGYRWHTERPDGDRVDPADVVIDGAPLELDATYRVTVNDFLASGGDGFAVLREGKDAVEHETDAAALEGYLKAGAASEARPARVRRE